MIYEDLIYESILVPEDNGKQNQIKQIKETICLQLWLKICVYMINLLNLLILSPLSPTQAKILSIVLSIVRSNSIKCRVRENGQSKR